LVNSLLEFPQRHDYGIANIPEPDSALMPAACQESARAVDRTMGYSSTTSYRAVEHADPIQTTPRGAMIQLMEGKRALVLGPDLGEDRLQ
jgi:hypothetical protein